MKGFNANMSKTWLLPIKVSRLLISCTHDSINKCEAIKTQNTCFIAYTRITEDYITYVPVYPI